MANTVLDKNIRLTIAIPTFNRNTILLENIKLLVSQLTPEVKLIIMDNSSDTPVSQTLQAISGELQKVNFEIIRNKVNIGGANIVRCFEICETEWLWILGDDDIPCPDAVKTVLSYVKEEPDCIFFNFSSEIYLRKKSFITKGKNEFIKKTDSWSSVIFISVGIYKASVMRRYVETAYRYIYSYAPQNAILLAALDAERKCFFSNQQIVHWVRPGEELRWPMLIQYNFFFLLELVQQKSAQRKLAHDISMYVPNMKQMAFDLLSKSAIEPDIADGVFFYNKALYLFSYCNRKIWLRIRYNFYKLYYISYGLFRFKLVRLIFKLFKGKQIPGISSKSLSYLLWEKGNNQS